MFQVAPGGLFRASDGRFQRTRSWAGTYGAGMHTSPQQPYQQPYPPQQPQQWAPQPSGPYGAPQLPAPRKTPWFKILLGILVVGVAFIALMVTAANNSMPTYGPAQSRDICALLIGGRTVDQVAGMTAGRYGWTVAEARNVAEEIRSRGC